MSFADGLSCRRLDHYGHRGRSGRAGSAGRSCGASRSLGNHRPHGRAAGNCGRWRRNHNGRRGAGLGNNLARFRASRRYGRRRGGDHRRRWARRGLLRRNRSRDGGLRGRMAVARHRFVFLFLGQNGLQHIAGFGNMREIDFGRNALRGARRLCACLACRPRSAVKMRAHLVGLVVFQRAGMSLPGGQAELCQYVENLSALDLHLARKIVNSNLTHPPLFKL